MNTRSQPGATWLSRKRIASRSWRLMRLRTVALPMRLLTEKPKRDCGRLFFRLHNTSSESAKLRPCCRTSWKRLFSRTLWRRFTSRSVPNSAPGEPRTHAPARTHASKRTHAPKRTKAVAFADGCTSHGSGTKRFPSLYGLASGQLDSQHFAPPAPSTLDNIAAAGRAHAVAKPVCPQAFAHLWLPCAFWHHPLPVLCTRTP